MPQFSERSKKRLGSADPRLQDLFYEVIKHFDCVVLEGHRSKESQDAAVEGGFSKTPWPTSKHNGIPSQAVDAIPYPVDWNDTNRIRYFAGFVKGIASQMGIGVRWGGDWDNDTDLKDQKFMDLVHFELSD